MRHIVFLLAFLLAQTNASPIHQQSEVTSTAPAAESRNFTSVAERIFATKPSWHDPCGIKHRFKDLHTPPPPSFMMHVQRPNDNDLLHGIVNMAKMALRKSRHFKEDYVSTATIFSIQQKYESTSLVTWLLPIQGISHSFFTA